MEFVCTAYTISCGPTEGFLDEFLGVFREEYGVSRIILCILCVVFIFGKLISCVLLKLVRFCKILFVHTSLK